MRHPDEVLRNYVESIDSGDFNGAYDMLSSAQRRQMSREDFIQAAQEFPDEIEAQARELRRQLEQPIPVEAEQPLATGDVASLVLHQGRWRIAGGAAGSVSLSSPFHAIRSLRRALQRRSYQSVLRVLNREARAQIEDEISRIIDGLEDEESLNIEITGNRAIVIYDDNHYIDLEREDGEWVIVDLN